MKAIIGTCHFVSVDKAIDYYHYEYPKKDVLGKIERGEIVIGLPTLKPDETLSIIDNGSRYAITVELKE